MLFAYFFIKKGIGEILIKIEEKKTGILKLAQFVPNRLLRTRETVRVFVGMKK